MVVWSYGRRYTDYNGVRISSKNENLVTRSSCYVKAVSKELGALLELGAPLEFLLTTYQRLNYWLRKAATWRSGGLCIICPELSLIPKDCSQRLWRKIVTPRYHLTTDVSFLSGEQEATYSC